MVAKKLEKTEDLEEVVLVTIVQIRLVECQNRRLAQCKAILVERGQAHRVEEEEEVEEQEQQEQTEMDLIL